MNELEFKIWLTENKVSKKVQSDLVCRLKKLQRELGNFDIDERYRTDHCSSILRIFDKKGINLHSRQFPDADLPFGKYQLSAYKYALNMYIRFLDSQQV